MGVDEDELQFCSHKKTKQQNDNFSPLDRKEKD